jgi:hypothetical protein
MNPMTDSHRLRHQADGDNRLRQDMEATARVHAAADSADVDEAMASVRWERRGLLQRLTRGSR